MSSQGSVRITGVSTTPGQNGSVPLRRELRELQANNPDQFNLYILGLRALQAKPKEDLTSYFQIAGIHGRPFKAWDNVQSSSGWTSFGGYCTHSSILFVPWHRPYLALFEQSLYKAVQDVAAQFPSNLRDRYVAAAKDFRIPYWDFAARLRAGASAFPSAISSPRVTVVDVDGQSKTINNPLYSFNIAARNPANDDFPPQWDVYPTTVRYPDRNGNSRNAVVGQVLANESASRRSNLALLLLSYTDFDAFTDDRWRGPGNNGNFGSLEDVHNEIHDQTGGGGHMSSLEMSAFDPVFWLHHCNVDRLWAMWQALNPNEYLSPRPAPWDTFTTRAGTIENQDTPLSPFWDASGTKFWTSAQVKNSATFGYAYPETQSWNFTTADRYQTQLRQTITTLYGANVFRNFAETVAASQPTPRPLLSLAGRMRAPPAEKNESIATVTALSEKKEAQVPLKKDEELKVVKVEEPPENPAEPGKLASPTGPVPESLQHLAPNNQYTEWIANVRAEKHGLNQTYRVLFFDGAFNPDPTSWPLEFNVVGRVTLLGRRIDTSCERCQDHQASHLITTGTVPLTSALLQDIRDGDLASLEAKDVVPYLKEKLNWRVTLFDGTEHPLDQVPGLKVSITSVDVTIGDDGVPHYSRDYTTHTDITTGKPGGLTDEDDD